MKFAGQDKYGYLVVKHLHMNGPQTVRELADAIDITIHSAGQALRRMMNRGHIEATGQFKGVGCKRAQIYRWSDIEGSELHEPMLNDSERSRALELADRAIGSLRTGYNPAMFDPFRVLRAQVAA